MSKLSSHPKQSRAVQHARSEQMFSVVFLLFVQVALAEASVLA